MNEDDLKVMEYTFLSIATIALVLIVIAMGE